jgi:hypothetical protein
MSGVAFQSGRSDYLNAGGCGTGGPEGVPIAGPACESAGVGIGGSGGGWVTVPVPPKLVVAVPVPASGRWVVEPGTVWTCESVAPKFVVVTGGVFRPGGGTGIDPDEPVVVPARSVVSIVRPDGPVAVVGWRWSWPNPVVPPGVTLPAC